MRQRIFLLPFVLLAILLTVLACDSANPVAPGGTVLTVTANPTLIGLTGESSLITITGFRPDGNPLNPGTQITLSTNLGTLSQSTTSVGNDGRAQVTLTGNGQPGDAMVSVTTPGSDSMAMVQVQIGESDTTRPTVAVTVPSILELNQEVDVVAIVRNADGSNAGSGQVVQFRADLGQIDASASTNSQGEAVARYRAGEVPGMVTITASVGASAEVTTMATIGAPTLSLSANPDIVDAGATSVITIIGRNSTGGALTTQPIVDIIATRGAINPSQVQLDQSGRAVAEYTAGDETGDGTVEAFMAGLAMSATTTVSIRDNAATVLVEATPNQVSVSIGSDVVLNLVATVLNAAGEPAQGVQVVFSTSDNAPGVLGSGGAARIVNPQGQATDTLTITPEQIDDFMVNDTFQVFANSGNVSDADVITVTN